jgi:hypothetical protein
VDLKTVRRWAETLTSAALCVKALHDDALGHANRACSSERDAAACCVTCKPAARALCGSRVAT